MQQKNENFKEDKERKKYLRKNWKRRLKNGRRKRIKQDERAGG